PVLVGARRLSDYHNVRIGIADTEDELRARLPQRASLAGADHLIERFERRRRNPGIGDRDKSLGERGTASVDAGHFLPLLLRTLLSRLPGNDDVAEKRCLLVGKFAHLFSERPVFSSTFLHL